jgi:Na+/H+-dicarboxylate symporter
MRSHLWIGTGLAAGILLGIAAYALDQRGEPQLAALAAGIRPIGTLFVNLLSMVVIPLVATALFSGIARLGDLRTVGRLLLRTLAYFWGTALVGIALGFLVGAAVLPYAAVSAEQRAALRGADVSAVQQAAQSMPTGLQFVAQLVPANPFKAAADGNLLPVIVFVTIFAAAAATLPSEKRSALITIADATTDVLIRIVHWVLLLAPIGIFALVAPVVTQLGWSLLVQMFWFIAAVVAGTLLLIAAVYLPSVVLLAKTPARRFLRAAFPSMLMGFSTTSSMAALPTMFEAADDDLAIARPISGFVLPLGATINRGGSALYQAIALLFIARLYGVPFGAGEMLSAAAAVFLASLTVAAVPSGSVLSLFPAFQATSLPLAGIPLLIGLDRIPDMFRTMTNVTGHLATAVVVSAAERPRAS